MTAHDLALAKMVVEAAAKMLEGIVVGNVPADYRFGMFFGIERCIELLRETSIEALALPVERLPEDKDAMEAQLYRWVRARNADPVHFQMKPSVSIEFPTHSSRAQDGPRMARLTGDYLDAAIDAAIAKEPK